MATINECALKILVFDESMESADIATNGDILIIIFESTQKDHIQLVSQIHERYISISLKGLWEIYAQPLNHQTPESNIGL
jgi:hypothetical protein